MADRALQNAERRRDALAAQINNKNQELEELRKDLAAVEKFIEDWHQFAESTTGQVPNSKSYTGYPQVRMASEIPVVNDSGPAPIRKNPDRATVGNVAKSVIYDRGRPVPRSELFKALAERGVEISGKDPEMVLSTMMWRMQDEFVRLPKHGYWVKSLRWPAARYEPGDAPQSDIEDAIQLNAALQDEEVP